MRSPRAGSRRAAAAAVLLLLCACARKDRPDTIETIAVIDGAPVALASFRAYFEANAGRPIAESRPAVVSGLFDQFLREETWRREAGLSSGDENAQRRDAPAALLARAGDAIRPSPADIREEYDRHPDRYRRPEEASVARIFTRSKPEADRARGRLTAGGDFGAVAREVSRSPDAPRGGRVGWVRRGDLPSEFEEAVFRLKPGGISPVISAEEGFLIFTVTERRPARVLTAEEAEPEIRERIAREKAESYLQGLVEAARRENRLRIFADRLPFVYTGSLLSVPPAGAP
jgi:hypothetical protein